MEKARKSLPHVLGSIILVRMRQSDQREQEHRPMSTCLVAQSGGPTAVINASLAGVIRANQLNPLYDRVLGGIHGIEGVLADQLSRPHRPFRARPGAAEADAPSSALARAATS